MTMNVDDAMSAKTSLEAMMPYRILLQSALDLSGGTHTFEVKARDRDFNEDPTPASVTFTVLPPVWQEPWFIGLMVVLLGAVGFQTGRVVRRDRRLRESNAALSDANKELFQANVSLDRERAVERVRAEVTGMTSVDDLRGVVEEMLLQKNSPLVVHSTPRNSNKTKRECPGESSLVRYFCVRFIAGSAPKVHWTTVPHPTIAL